jgi:hypothetical protein
MKGGTHWKRYEGCGAKYHIKIPYDTWMSPTSEEANLQVWHVF